MRFCVLGRFFGVTMQLLDTFLAHLRNERRSSPHTATAYRTDLLDFGIFCEGELGLKVLENTDHLNAVTPRIVRAWIGSMKAERTTMSRKLSALRSYCRYYFRRGVLQSGLQAKFTLPKKAKRTPTFVPTAPMAALLDRPLPDSKDFELVRNHAMLELLYGAGLRRSELIQMKSLDIDWGQRMLRVMGKGRKERMVPFGQTVSAALNAYADAAAAKGIDTSETFFLTEKGQALYPQLVYRLVNESLAEVDGLRRRSPHVLRHTYATHLVDAGADLNAVKELLGHGSLAATQVYVHSSISRLKKIHAQAHPKG
jgi:integrase/recombinase XerC